MVKLISEYRVKSTGAVLTTAQESDTVEEAIEYVLSRPMNYIKDNISTYYQEPTQYGLCTVLVTVEGEMTERNYYILSEETEGDGE